MAFFFFFISSYLVNYCTQLDMVYFVAKNYCTQLDMVYFVAKNVYCTQLNMVYFVAKKLFTLHNLIWYTL